MERETAKKVYIVEVESGNKKHTSQVAYRKFDDAVKFIESRTDKPKRIGNDWIFVGENIYEILELEVN